MKVLLDLQACQASSRQRGIGRYSMALAQSLVRAGPSHEWHILLNGAFADTIAPIRADFAGLVAPDRVHVFHALPDSRDDAVNQGWRVRAAVAIRRCAIRQVAPDVLHVASLFEGLRDDCVAEIDPERDGVPTSVTVYDFIPHLYSARYLARASTRAWYKRRLAALRRADLLLGISGSACAEAEAILTERRGEVVNVSSAADPRVFHPAARGDTARRLGLTRPFVMYTGGTDWRKNLDGVVTAFAQLPKALRARHQLAIVCHVERHVRTLLEAHAKRAGLAPDEMVLTGFVPDEDLADLYRSCELFVFPSLHEGFGLPALEAMMCGAAVIGSNTSSVPEVIGRDDALFDPRSPAAMSALMQRALADDGFRAALKAHAPVQAARFSWERSAHTALQALEDLHRRNAAAPSPVAARPRLAMLTPLPPAASGIADYACELLGALQEHYEIELVHDQSDVQLPSALAHLPVHDLAWFRQNASRFDRIVYHFGNSALHAPMFDLLREWPGVVVLHDFFLSGVLNWMERAGGVPDAFRRALLRSHGREAVQFDRSHDRLETVARFPASRFVAERAAGVIVTSRHSLALGHEWWGSESIAGWRHIPLPRALPQTVERVRARDALGLAPDDFLVCSFGQIAATKLTDRLLQAWHASALARDARCRLVLVGGTTASPYATQVLQLATQDRVSITGYAPREVYERHLCAADLAVQLRTQSRGESSGAVLDCMAYGIPLICNANGAIADSPQSALHALPDAFTDADLVAALEALRNDEAERRRLATEAHAHVAAAHDPALVAQQYRDTIETFSGRPQHRPYWDAVAAIGALGAAPKAALEDAAVALEATWVRGAA